MLDVQVIRSLHNLVASMAEESTRLAGDERFNTESLIASSA